jgi:hypothetical protein
MGSGALALAARVGAESPTLTRNEKAVLAYFLNNGAGQRPGGGRHAFKVVSDKVQCRASSVDITEHDCSLTFGTKTVTIEGHEAQALYATLAENGVAPDGAAGSSYRAVQSLSCNIDPKAIEDRDGSGARCTYTSAQ